jgi:hypothetical protein
LLDVGQILLAYGEIELLATQCLGSAIGDYNVAARVMFRSLGESARIDTADVLMRDAFIAHGLENEYARAIGAARQCTALRNQYAHVHWGGDDKKGGVFFANLKDSVGSVSGEIKYRFRHVDIPLLEDQWDYMRYAADCLTYINYELRLRRDWQGGHNGVMPAERSPPNPHNDPLEHVPPWISEDEQRQHLEHFGGQARTHPHQPKAKPLSTRERREAGMWRAELGTARGRLVRLLRQKPDR